jgi:septation ring formation regulator EzrA
LLQTGTQIKNRLADSLAKFQEYEGALETIMKNLESLEPQVKERLAKPVEEVADLQQEFDDFKVNI